jgi:hypothetical protein
VAAVQRAYFAFIVKFKPKSCLRFLAHLSEWGFDGLHASTAQVDEVRDTDKRLRIEGVTHAERAMAETIEDPSGDVSASTLTRWTVTFAMFNHLVSTLGVLFDFAFPLVTTAAVSLLQTFHAASRSSVSCRSIRQIAAAKALEAVLEGIHGMGSAQAQAHADAIAQSVSTETYFSKPEVFDVLMPALVQQIGNVGYLSAPGSTYEERISRAVVPAITSFMRATPTVKLWSRTQQEIIKHSRNRHAAVRKCCLTVLRGVYAKEGQHMVAVVMSEILTAVVEMTEDASDEVVEEARLLCKELSALSGQDVLHMMS